MLSIDESFCRPVDGLLLLDNGLMTPVNEAIYWYISYWFYYLINCSHPELPLSFLIRFTTLSWLRL